MLCWGLLDCVCKDKALLWYESMVLLRRAEGIMERCFAAAKDLPLQSQPGLALSFATIILACSVHDTALLAQPAAFPLIQRLIQARPSLHRTHAALPIKWLRSSVLALIMCTYVCIFTRSRCRLSEWHVRGVENTCMHTEAYLAGALASSSSWAQSPSRTSRC